MLGYKIKSNFKNFPKVDFPEKMKIKDKGLELFSKSSYHEKYNVLIS
jgi:hypothetical protein